MTDKQKFGLIMPKKAEKFKMQRSSIFNDESDEDENYAKRPKIPQKKIETKSKIKTEALEDPSIYEYDNIYDEMKSKEKEKIAPKEKKNSRYIDTLLKAADKRKKEYERRVDRKIELEREKEGDKFKDKEAFVTSAYKKKMQEKEEEEERERRENMLNDMMDVTKQKDLSGFYRHFLNQTIGEEKVPVFGEKQIKQEVVSDQENSAEINKENKNDKSSVDNDNIDKDSDIEIDSDDHQSVDAHSDSEAESKDTTKKSRSHNRRNKHEKRKFDKGDSRAKFAKKYRMSNVSSDEKSNDSEDDRAVSSLKEHKLTDRTETDDKCDRSSDQASDSDEFNKESAESSQSKHKTNSDKIDKKENSTSRHDSSSDSEAESKSANSDVETDISKNRGNSKRNIYAKRTVGEVFAEAQARYFQRLAARNLGT